MILAYEFVYISPNAVLENFLYAIAAEAKREFYVKKLNETITLFVRGDEAELAAFSDLLAEKLPASIFLRRANVTIAAEWRIEEASAIEPCETPIAFTPKTLKLAEQSGDYKIAPEIGRRIALDDMPPIEEVAERLLRGESAAIEGKYTISPLTNRQFDENVVIMPTDISFIASAAIAKEEDIIALGSLERPILRLCANLIFSLKYPKAPRIISVALASDLYLCLLSKKLAESGVTMVALEHYDRVVVTALKSQNLIARGLSNAGAKFAIIKEPHYRAFAAAIDERNLRGEANLGFFFSLKSDDRVIFSSPEMRAIELLKTELPSSIAELFSSIEKRDQNGAKLIASYRERYGETANAIKTISLANAPRNIASIWGIAGLLLGVCDNFESACEKMIERVACFDGLKSPSADYKLNGGAIDPLSPLSSAISLKLAGASDDLIACGFCESLARFLSDVNDLIAAGASAEAGLRQARNADGFLASLDIEAPKNIFLLGSLFSLKTFSELAVAYISPAKTPFFPNAAPLEL
ncbi:MAG: hypothetical protein LBI57_04910 [Helicobacteraceae bacterium]|jgi:hypothetical protein|nr:hypothetical protein [Helicobacteraceae bacterium]